MAQLKIQITAANGLDGSSQVYLAEANQLYLSFQNQTGGTLQMTGGSPQEAPPPGAASALVLDLSSLFNDPSQQAGLSVTAPGWTAQYFADDPRFPVWVLAPEASYGWGATETLQVTVENLTPTAATGTYYLTASLYNAGINRLSSYTPTLVVSNPPSQHKDLLQTLGVDVAVNPDSSFDSRGQRTSYVGITKRPDEPYPNRIQITLYNKSGSFPIVPPTTPWGSTPPRFTVSFVPASEAPGYFALTTPTLLESVTPSIVSGTLGWDFAALPGTPRRWAMTPLRSNHQILGTGAQAIAQFELNDVVTQLVRGPTLMYLQYSNIPGYDDGFTAVLLDKEYGALAIEYLKVTPDQIAISDYSAHSATLSWKVHNSTLVQVDGVGTPADAPLPGTGAAVVEADTTRTFVLTAYDTRTGKVKTSTATLTVSPDLTSRWTPVGAIALWSGAPGDVPAGWGLCDGTRGTPDLRDLFVVGSGSVFPHGGSDRAPTHIHSLAGMKVTSTLERAGRHSHGVPIEWYGRNYYPGTWAGIDSGGKPAQRLQDDGEHTHTLAVDYSSLQTAPSAGSVLPAWFALCYVMLLDPARA
jgi:hypothetical protein